MYLIPLKTSHNNRPIEEAIDFTLKCRVLIFNGRLKKEFQLLTQEGKVYFQKMYYASLDKNIVKKLIEKKWYYPNQKELISSIQEDINKYNYYMVNRQKKDKSFLMIYCEEK